MKVLVVSGFLGAGKTTFIKELAEFTKKDFAIMENEYGQVGIDGTLLSEDRSAENGSINIWELTEGCICCSMKSDFASSVLTISNTVDPEYLIVEPTGVGMLSRVIENLKKIQYERIEILNPVTLLDFHSFDRYMKEFPEIYKDQIMAAGSILISKSEQADSTEINALKKKLLSLNPHGDIFEKSYYFEKEERVWSFLQNTLTTAPKDTVVDASLNLENMSIEQSALPTANHLLWFLNGVVSGVFGEIIRAKGYLPCGNCTLHFEVSDRLYSITGFEMGTDSKCVFIGRNIKRNLIRQALQSKIYLSLSGKRNKGSLLQKR